jgi:hypothetical protein
MLSVGLSLVFARGTNIEERVNVFSLLPKVNSEFRVQQSGYDKWMVNSERL